MILPKVLFIDDDPDVLEQMRFSLQEHYSNLEFELDWQQGIKSVEKDPHAYSLVFVDHQHVNTSGLLEARGPLIANKIKCANPSIKVIMLSGDKSERALTSWLDIGVDHFIHKPVKTDIVMAFIHNAQEAYENSFGSRLPMTSLLPSSGNNLGEKLGFVCSSKVAEKMGLKILNYAATEYPIFINGETGAGKELVAKAIHKNSGNSEKKLLALDCTKYSKSSELLMSELFGHVKGSFTGAVSDKIGLFEAANGATIFIDEIHHLSLEAQAKLLRVIENKTIVRVGEYQERKVNFRLISAGQPVIEEMVAKNTFFQDLYQRLLIFEIKVPKLSERTDEMEILISYLQNTVEKETGKRKQFSPKVIRSFKNYNWPGNIRGLLNTIRKLTVDVKGNMINYGDLPDKIKFNKSTNLEDNQLGLAELLKRFKQNNIRQEKQLIITALREANGNVTKAAKSLGLNRSLVRRRIIKFNLEDFAINENIEPKGLIFGNIKQKMEGIYENINN